VLRQSRLKGGGSILRVLAAVLALIVCGIAPAGAEPPSVARADVLWAGLYEADVGGTISQPDTAAGRTNELFNTRKVRATTIVEGRLGASFGLEYTLIGKPTGASVPVTIVVRLPKAGLKNPAKAERIYREQWVPAAKPIGSSHFVGYTFEHTWEVVPGLWIFEIWSEDQKLGEQSFCVLAERPAEADKKEPCRSVPTV
jgi:Domain of unknown function (DUF3859)